MRASSSSTVGLYGGGRVPPPHPFLRSSSVPEQPSIYDPFLEEDGLIPEFHNHYPPTYRAAPPLGVPSYPSAHSPLYYSSDSRGGGTYLDGTPERGASRFAHGGGGAWRSSSYLERDPGPWAHRLGRQFSVSSEIPTSDERTCAVGGSYGKHYASNYNAGGGSYSAGGDPAYARSHVIPSSIPPSNSAVYGSRVSTSTAGTSRSNPLTLGRSLQLVTSGSSVGGVDGSAGSGGVLAGGGGGTEASRRKKTVRFNSEEWGSNNGAPSSHHHSLNNPYLNCDDFEEEEDLWMTIEDVRCGRWARWDALRQESQESQTRDSGIETGSCFTSSEDSNRGDYIHKKHPVSWHPSADGGRLMGHMILLKSLKEGFVPSSSATLLGIKVIGGKLLVGNRIGAVIEKVKKGSIADSIGRVLPGDEILEWNGRSLTNKTYDEVHDVIAESRHDPQVELRVCRYLGNGAGSAGGPLTSVNNHVVDIGRQPLLADPLHGRYPPGRGPPARSTGGPGRPSVTLSDPLGDTHMLNHLSTGSRSSGTRIQVSPDWAVCFTE
eukprot:snap_masked-scaffold783_size97670-processed-gene-0.16 protein:Tk08993 transcript:snap_masked-scaffold783_size97670-processed-gene-0.16-mRNA-1 annotation:"GL12021"